MFLFSIFYIWNVLCYCPSGIVKCCMTLHSFYRLSYSSVASLWSPLWASALVHFCLWLNDWLKTGHQQRDSTEDYKEIWWFKKGTDVFIIIVDPNQTYMVFWPLQQLSCVYPPVHSCYRDLWLHWVNSLYFLFCTDCNHLLTVELIPIRGFYQVVCLVDGSPCFLCLEPRSRVFVSWGHYAAVGGGCRCLMPLCTSWLTYVRAGVLSRERLYTRSCLQQLLPSRAAERAEICSAFCWDIILYLIQGGLLPHLQGSRWDMSKLVRDLSNILF